MRSVLFVLLVCSFGMICPDPAAAALPPEVRKELSAFSRELRTVSVLVRKKQVEEAKAIVAKVDERIAELEIAEDERDRSYTALARSLKTARNAIPVSFISEVAPIIKDNCLNCHGDQNPRGNLRLDSYAAMGRGGATGPLLIPRNPQRSHIMGRLVADGQARMPRGSDQLSDQEIGIIGRWIAGGAPFDGEDMSASITLTAAATVGGKPRPKVNVVMADGSESVSFKDDVAPMLVNICQRCHNGNNTSGGLNLTTFETLLQGGDTGDTVVPGDPDSSYIVDLVLRQDPIKMPSGNQTRIKRSQAQTLAKWIREGARFDGGNPKAPLRNIVPTAEELEAGKLTSMSDDDFSERRIKQAQDMWKRVAPREQATAETTENLYVYGNAPQSRLEELAKWGEAQVTQLTSQFKTPGGSQPWRGRLIVFVSKTRFDYEEFNTVLLNRRTPRGVSGHSVVTANADTVYVAMVDTGDAESVDTLNTQQLLNSLLAQAYLGRSGADLPDWLQEGFGLMQSGAGPKSAYMKLVPQKAAEALRTVTNPATVFDDGTFSPQEVGPVGMLLTRFLLNRGGPGKLAQLTRELQSNRNAGRAVQATYGQNARDLGAAFLR